MNNTMLKRLLSVVMAVAMVMSMVVMPVSAADDCAHASTTETVTATCTADGTKTVACNDCGETVSTEDISATGHSYTVVDTATCTEAGTKTSTCGTCNDVQTEDSAAKGHTYDATTGECTAEGCDAVKPAEETPDEETPTECTCESICSENPGCDFCAIEGNKCKFDETDEAPVVTCTGLAGCTANPHNTDCAEYDPCAALGCTDETHHADCPWGPCTKTEGCELAKDHPGSCDGRSLYTAFDAAQHTVKIGDAGFATLKDAIETANTMTGEVTVEIHGKTEYTADTENLTDTYNKISFVGKTATAEISITRNGSNGYISGAGSAPAVSFTDLILSKPSGDYANDAGFMNVYFTVYRVASVDYTNCTFPDGACAQGCPVSYTNCKFANTTTGEYSLWVYANTTTTVDSCEFTGVRGAKMYGEGAAKTGNLILKNSTFTESVTEKPAIVLTYGESITLQGNSSYPAKGVFELDADGSPDGTTVTADITDIACLTEVGSDDVDCGVMVGGKIYRTVTEAAQAAESGDNVVIMYTTEETAEFPAGTNVTTSDGNNAENVTVKPTVAMIGDTAYGTLKDAVTAASDGATVKLTASYEDYTMIQVSKKLTIDLNGYNIYRTFGGIAVDVTSTGDLTIKDSSEAKSGKISGTTCGISVNIGKLTLESGTVESRDSDDNSTGIVAKGDVTINGGTVTGAVSGVSVGNSLSASTGKLTINGGTVRGTKYGAELGGDGTSITVTGGTLEGETGISSNSAYANTTVDISGGTVSGGELGIYQPNNGTTNISGGTVTGNTGINVKSGALNVSGGTVSGTGPKVDHTFIGGGFASTGDGIVVENAQNYNSAYETPTVSITGGTVTSKNATAVTSYAASNGDTALTQFISGGTFVGKPDDALAVENYTFQENSAGQYILGAAPEVAVAEVGGINYLTLQEAFNVGGTVKLLKDVVLTEPAVVPQGKSVTLNMDGKTIKNDTVIWNEAEKEWSLVSVRGSLTVTGNGRMQALANDCFAIDVRDGGALTVENGTFVGNLSAVYVYEGSAEIKGGNYSVQQKNTSIPDGYVLNCYDAHYGTSATITVTGGTFAGYDPANTTESYLDNIKYCTTANGTNYTVNKHTITESSPAVAPTYAKGGVMYPYKKCSNCETYLVTMNGKVMRQEQPPITGPLTIENGYTQVAPGQDVAFYNAVIDKLENINIDASRTLGVAFQPMTMNYIADQNAINELSKSLSLYLKEATLTLNPDAMQTVANKLDKGNHSYNGAIIWVDKLEENASGVPNVHNGLNGFQKDAVRKLESQANTTVVMTFEAELLDAATLEEIVSEDNGGLGGVATIRLPFDIAKSNTTYKVIHLKDDGTLGDTTSGNIYGGNLVTSVDHLSEYAVVAVSNTIYVADPTNPKTGDSIFMAMSVMTFSAAALAVLLLGKKKRA